MEIAFWQDLNIENFNVFIRDLSSSMNTNIKYMIEDLDKEKDKIKDKGKQKQLKKDLIILEQNIKRHKKIIEEDKEK